MRTSDRKWVYAFENGDGRNKMLLGGKGANLCEMTRIGLNVPPGFVITTEGCLAYLEDAQRRLPDGVMDEVRAHMRALEQKTGKKFGGSDDPLLVSVRSGSAMSMPGMMDTILNLGLNETTLAALIRRTGNERFGYDAWRRFIQLFGKVALGVPDHAFDEQFDAVKARVGVKQDVMLGPDDLRDIGDRFLKVVQQHTGHPFPSDPYEQLEIAIKAVFNSWMGKRAIDYRREFKITPAMANGTAVNVVTMVFGNMGNDSATGVGFTRNPATGENQLYGEYLTNAQGEDVVAGIRTPKPIADLATEMPAIYTQLVDLRNRLERHYREVQDFEFTIEQGRLWMLQVRVGKRTPQAALRMALDMAEDPEFPLGREEAVRRIIDQMRVSVPDMIKQAERTVGERDRIVAQANEEASRIIQLAREQATDMVEHDELAEAARKRANELLAEAEREAASMRSEADKYALNSLSGLAEQVTKLQREVENGMRALTGE